MTEPGKTPKGFRNWLVMPLSAVSMGLMLLVAPDARASGGGHGGASASESSRPQELQIPETVIQSDSIALTVVLPKGGAIRQMVFHVWLEASSVTDRAIIEQAEPKLQNAFLRDLQRIMYRDTQNRYEKLEEGKRGFVYNGPELIAPPLPNKTPEELEAEQEAAEAAKEKGEEIKSEPPFSPFAPTTNRYFAALQNRLLATARGIVPPESIRSVQVRKFYDNWPGDKKPGR